MLVLTFDAVFVAEVDAPVAPLEKASTASEREGKDLYRAPENLSMDFLQVAQSLKTPVSRPAQTT